MFQPSVGEKEAKTEIKKKKGELEEYAAKRGHKTR